MSSRPHKWDYFKAHKKRGRIVPWPYCRCCGLVRLKNQRSERAARQPCPDREDD